MVWKNDVAEVVDAIVLWEVLELELVLNKTHPYSRIKRKGLKDLTIEWLA